MTTSNRFYFIDIDTETAPLYATEKVDPMAMVVYDMGWVIANKLGKIFKERSFLIREIWENPTLMNSAYYAEKIPLYLDMLERGEIQLVSFFEAYAILLQDMEEYGIDVVCAHNARFDVSVLNNTIRMLTETRYTRFFAPTVTIWDSMLMAGSTICKQKTYRAWCEHHDMMTKNHQVRKTAEALYRYCYGDWDFDESHTALDDAKIETLIVARCFAQHKTMRKVLYAAEV